MTISNHLKWSVYIIILPCFLSCNNVKSEKEPLEEVINKALDLSLAQSARMAEKYLTEDSILPRSFIDGKMTTSKSKWWTSGFFPGVLWYLYEYSEDSLILTYAQEYTARIEKEKHSTDNHDIGFMLYNSFGNGLRLTEVQNYEEVLLTGAGSLATRFDSDIGVIRSWDFNKDRWQYPVIIDNMINLELLMWASKESEISYDSIAISHAKKTLTHHYRPDYSCYHVVSYDTVSGLPHIKQTHQGFSDESAWSRGQAWGLYGFTMMYRETGDKEFLDQAIRIASYMIGHPNMPDDYIPYWDYNAPEIPKALRDASAAAIMASALIELSTYVKAPLTGKYLSVAEKQIRTLASPEYSAQAGENGHFILKHGVGSMPHDSEIDVPLTYGDYYYVEALVRYKKHLKTQ